MDLLREFVFYTPFQSLCAQITQDIADTGAVMKEAGLGLEAVCKTESIQARNGGRATAFTVYLRGSRLIALVELDPKDEKNRHNRSLNKIIIDPYIYNSDTNPIIYNSYQGSFYSERTKSVLAFKAPIDTSMDSIHADYMTKKFGHKNCSVSEFIRDKVKASLRGFISPAHEESLRQHYRKVAAADTPPRASAPAIPSPATP